MEIWIDNRDRIRTGARPERSRKPAKCPACGAKPMARIQYGLPAFTPELKRDLDAGRVVVGGCCINGDDPSWQCAKCGEQVWRKGEARKNRFA